MSDWFLRYKLDAKGEPIPCKILGEWAQWFETADRSVARTEIDSRTYVSTVFLSLNHNFSPDGDPILWETMVFVKQEGELKERELPPQDIEQRRCSGSREQAEAMHSQVVSEWRARLGK